MIWYRLPFSESVFVSARPITENLWLMLLFSLLNGFQDFLTENLPNILKSLLPLITGVYCYTAISKFVVLPHPFHLLSDFNP